MNASLNWGTSLLFCAGLLCNLMMLANTARTDIPDFILPMMVTALLVGIGACGIGALYRKRTT